MASISLRLQHTTHINSLHRRCRTLSSDRKASFFDSNTGCIWEKWLYIWKKTMKCTPFLYAPDPKYPYCNPFDFLQHFKLNETTFWIITSPLSRPENGSPLRSIIVTFIGFRQCIRLSVHANIDPFSKSGRYRVFFVLGRRFVDLWGLRFSGRFYCKNISDLCPKLPGFRLHHSSSR